MKHWFFFFFFVYGFFGLLLNISGVQLLYNVVLFSAVQHMNQHIYICVCVYIPVTGKSHC